MYMILNEKQVKMWGQGIGGWMALKEVLECNCVKGVNGFKYIMTGSGGFFWDCTDEGLDSVPYNVVISQTKKVILRLYTSHPKSQLQFN
jgi:hypothetical protein